MTLTINTYNLFNQELTGADAKSFQMKNAVAETFGFKYPLADKLGLAALEVMKHRDIRGRNYIFYSPRS